ncbi:MAG: YhgE/Pip family protein, partial [Brachybacterium sp.]|nr:YhgE/Pip family protein [Brachybacterium sp.]
MNILRYPRIIVVILLMPLVATMIGMWALQDRAEALDEVPAALVNLDEGATIEVDGEEQTVPFGRLLAGALTQPGTADDSEDLETTGFDWQLTDEESAAEGLRDGSYAAVIVIPEDFSEKLTTIGTPEAEQARIEVTTNDASGIINALVGEAVAQAASANIGDEMAQQYLSELYLGFNDISDSFAEAADGAGELAGGQRELTDGIGSTARGAEDLADGADELAGGQRQLAGGSSDTADGADQLAGGASQLAVGTRGLETGADELGGGLEQSAAGQRELAAGLGPLADGADELAQGNRDLADGLDQLADGA